MARNRDFSTLLEWFHIDGLDDQILLGLATLTIISLPVTALDLLDKQERGHPLYRTDREGESNNPVALIEHRAQFQDFFGLVELLWQGHEDPIPSPYLWARASP